MMTLMRARTEPDTTRFMKAITRRPDFDGLNGMKKSGEPEKKMTQEEQDSEDEKARKQAMQNLIGSWQERLQLISVITTFFATTEAAILVNTKPSDPSLSTMILDTTNACLIGALILHIYAAILSFLGAFLLISYKMEEATREEMIMEGIQIVHSPTMLSTANGVKQDAGDPGLRRTATNTDAPPTVCKAGENGVPKVVSGPNKQDRSAVAASVFSANPHVEQVGPFSSHELSHRILSRTHGLCVSLNAIGFVLAIAGIVCYAWATQTTSVRIFATACLGGSVLGMVGLFI